MAIGKLSKKSIITISILVVGILLYLFMMLFAPKARLSHAPVKQWPIEVVTLPLAAGHVPQIHLYGQVEHSRLTQLSASVESRVDQVAVKEGQAVKQGQLLVQLDTRELVITLKMHQADLDHVVAEISAEKINLSRLEDGLQHQKSLLDLSKQSLDRYNSLNQKKYVSGEDLNTKQRDYELRSMQYRNNTHEVDIERHRLVQLQARKKKLGFQVDLDNLHIDLCRSVAPEDGRITALPVTVGEHVKVGQVMIEVMPDQQKEVRALLPLPRIPEIQSQLAKIDLPVATASIAGVPVKLQLVRLTQRVLSGQAGQEGIFEAKAGGEHLVLGRHISLYLSLAAIPNSYAIPESALYHRTQVYTVIDDRLQAIPVHVVGWYYQGLQRDVIVQSDDLHPDMDILSLQLPHAVNGMRVLVQLPD